MVACDSAPGCDSFAYNPAQQKCFLKSGASRRTCGAAETVSGGRPLGQRTTHGVGECLVLSERIAIVAWWCGHPHPGTPCLMPHPPSARLPQVCVSARGSPYSCGTWQTYFKKTGNATVPLVDGNPTSPTQVQLVEAFAQP